MNKQMALKYLNNFIKYFEKNKIDGNKANLIVLGEEIDALRYILKEIDNIQDTKN